MLLWVVNHFIMEGNVTLQLEDNRNKDLIILFFKFTYPLNALRFKLLTWKKKKNSKLLKRFLNVFLI